MGLTSLGTAWQHSGIPDFVTEQEYIIAYREYRMPIATVETLSGGNVTST